MFKRQREGSVICVSCGHLVGVNDPVCHTCGRRNPGLWGFAPVFRSLGNDLGFVKLVITGTIVLYAVALLLSRDGMGPMLAPSTSALLALGASGALPVFGLGHWWTLLTAGWLHGGLLHIFFNVMWIRDLGPAIAEFYGPGRMVLIYTLSGVAGFAFSSIAGFYIGGLPLIGGATITVGASAPIFGLLGALVYYGRRTGSSRVGQTAVQYAVILGIYGLVSAGVDNQAHLGGFVGGYLAGRIFDPLKPERIDHIVAATACLLATFVAIAASLVTILPRLMA